MNTSILKTLTAAAVGVGLLVSPAAARDHSRHGQFWWESAGYSGANAYQDEYSYPGIRWYDDVDCGYGYGERHGRRHGHHHRHHHGEWRYDRERHDWR